MSAATQTPSPYLLLALANLFWAGNWIVGRAFREDMPPVALSFWRWAIALLCLWPFARHHLRADWPRLRTALPWLVLFALLGTTCYNALTYAALRHTQAINGLLLNSCAPVVIVALAWAFQGRRLQRVEASGIAISLIGVLVIVARGTLATLLDLQLNVGDLWVLISVLAWSAYTLLLTTHRPRVHPLAFLFAIVAIGQCLALPFYAWELAAGPELRPSLAALGGVAYAGIFAAFLGVVLWNHGVAAVGPARAGQFMHLMPVFGTALSVMLLGEQPMAYHAIGIALIFLGIWLNTR